jgi:hypothetical protein
MSENIIFTSNFWGTKVIPAILTKVEGCLPYRSDVWIPSGYEEGAGGYSTRSKTDIKEFTGPDEMKQDVMKQWEAEQQQQQQRT